MKRFRVVLAAKHTAVREALRKLLEPDYEIVGLVQDSSALLEAATKLQPDVVVTDIAMPGLGGIEVTKRFRASSPQARVIFLTLHREPVLVTEALNAGAVGYVMKRSASQDLPPAIREALQGRSFVSPSLREPDSG